MESLNLTGKVALVSAGTRGIGEAIAKELAAQGANVVAFSRSAETNEIAAGPGTILTLPADSTNLEELEKVINTVRERYGRLDILVNNTGGVPYYGPILDAEPEVWDNFLNINLGSTFLLTRLVVKSGLLAEGGSIVNISSVAGLRAGTAGLGIYSVAKAAQLMLTRQLARELSASRIRVNAIAPGLIKTEFSRTLWDNPQALNALMSTNPSGRLGTSEDIARAATFLASPASDYINGETLVVDGGGLA